MEECDVSLSHVGADKDIFATLLHGWPPLPAEHSFLVGKAERLRLVG